MDAVLDHYAIGNLADRIAKAMFDAGRNLARLTTADLAAIDEFHIRGRSATLELANRMALASGAHVLDIGSGLGGPARTFAESYSCRVTGVDLSPEFIEAAQELSRWVDFSDRVDFIKADATALPFESHTFDAAFTIHVAMNVSAKDAMYAEVHRVLKPGSMFAIYDILKGEGGDVAFPVPWARDPSISHLATPTEMRVLLTGAGFNIVSEEDTSAVSEAWFRHQADKLASSSLAPVGLRQFLGPDAAQMTLNQVRNLAERRIRTAMYVCQS